MDDKTNPPWISIQDAVELGAYSSVNALQLFLNRWNKNNPEHAVLRRWGKIHRETYLKALTEDALRKTPAARVAAAMGARA